MQNGVLDIRGFAPSLAERTAIRVAAEAIPGVVAVNDHLLETRAFVYQPASRHVTITNEVSMAHFTVRFLKNVIGDQGKSCEICQCIVDVDARHAAEPTLLAQQQFCEFREMGDWSLHADRIDVQPADRAGPGCLDSAPLDLSGFLPGYAERGALRFCRCVGRA
ncbi:hypothetical protein ACVIU7_004493 [Bradyrhizobium liaoningense]|nr:BON domain-containing protein [Bradyrhizobium japonicum USDA 135]